MAESVSLYCVGFFVLFASFAERKQLISKQQTTEKKNNVNSSVRREEENAENGGKTCRKQSKTHKPVIYLFGDYYDNS